MTPIWPFMTFNGLIKARADADTMPYQYSRDMRGEKTLQFYKNLNLEACIWEFENWFQMSELQQACGGEITTDGQVWLIDRPAHLLKGADSGQNLY